MKNFLKDGWVNVFIFIYSSVFTAGGIFMAVGVVIDNQELNSWQQVIESLLFINLGVGLTYLGLTGQARIYKEWKGENSFEE